MERGQKLQVFFFEGKVGKGKIESWEACSADAIKRAREVAQESEPPRKRVMRKSDVTHAS